MDTCCFSEPVFQVVATMLKPLVILIVRRLILNHNARGNFHRILETRMTLEDKIAILATNVWFSQLEARTRSSIVDHLVTKRVAGGEAMFQQGDPVSGLYVLLAGDGRITGSSADGLPALIGILRPGDWTGFLAVLDGGPYAFSAEMVTSGVAACLPITAANKIFGTDVDSFRRLVAPELTIARRNYHFYLETHGRPALRRVAERLMALGRWPYAASTGPLAPLDNVNQDDLAAATRLSRQRINTALRELQRRGLIKTGYGNVCVLDPIRLGHIAEGIEI